MSFCPVCGTSDQNEQTLARITSQRDAAIKLLAEWCVQVEDVGTGWDDWDFCYKEANYKEGPLHKLIDAKKEEIRKKYER